MAYYEYGRSDALRLVEDWPEPKIGPDTVVVRMRASGVNPVDWKLQEGTMDAYLDVYFPVIPGWDLAGVVERVGRAVPEFEVGDEVFGLVRRDEIHHGTKAELVPAPVRTLAHKPRSASWAEAGGLPLSGLTALRSIYRLGIKPGETVLIHGAAGGVGHYAVQIARILGARVIGTASPRNHEFLAGLGAEPVEYGEGLASRVRELAPDGIDASLDMVGFADSNALEQSFKLVTDPKRILSIAYLAVTAAGGQYVFMRPDSADLRQLAQWYDDGLLRTHVERTFPLEETGAAHDLVRTCHVRGKVVVVDA
ncbi:NADP-dependent oxidoreductase [Flindersiella endophytica]